MPRTLVNKTAYTLSRFNDFVRGELRRRHLSQRNLAEYLGMSRPSVTYRLNGEIEWSLEEFLNTLEFFGVDTTKINIYKLVKGEQQWH